MLSLIICDLDGLLADTEIHHFQAYHEVMADNGVDLTIEEYQSHWIRDGLTIREFLDKHNLDLDPKALHKAKVAKYVDRVSSLVEPMSGAVEFLKRFHSVKKLALATSSYKVGAQTVIDRLDMTKYFDLIITRDDVTKLKPDPEIFNLTAERSGVSNSECIVMEDAEKGINAAHSANMKSIAVPNIYTQDNNFGNATKVVASLDEVTLDFLDTI